MTITCDNCNGVFKTTQGLSRHKARKIACTIEDKRYICDRCGKKFTQKYNFNRHINRKTPCQNLLEEARAKIKIEDIRKEKELIDYQTEATLKILKIKNEYKKEILKLRMDLELGEV